MSLPLIRIVVPFSYDEAEKGVEFESELRDSILAQFGRGTIFDIEMVFVLQEKGGKVHRLQEWEPLPYRTLVFNADPYDYPTTFHQTEMGFKECLDANYCMYMTANDKLARGAIVSMLQRSRDLSAKVVYADTLRIDNDGFPYQCDKPETEFLPFKWFAQRERKIANPIPDICLIDCSILEMVPFDSKYKRASFMLWWYRIWEEYGHLAFAYVNTIGCLYRPHIGQASRIETWVFEGYDIANEWLAKRPWRKYTAYAGV